MNLKKLAKSEINGWKKHEIIGLTIIFMFIFINAIIVKDNIIAVISAICGILYSTIAGKGKISCYIFGLTGTCCYSWLAYSNGLWGNLALYMAYYFPMQIMGIWCWNKHLNKKREITKKSLSQKKRLLYSTVAIIMSCLAILILKITNGSNPFCDGITTVLSILGMYFTVHRYIEQWIIWFIVNGLSTIMWFILIIQGTKAYSTLIMWIVYLILSVYFYFVWKQELTSKQ